MADVNPNPTPQFEKAEYVGTPGNDHCHYCHQSVTGTYYRVNQAMACPACAEKLRGSVARDSHATYMRALLFGIGAALAGLALYATFAIVTGIIIGYASLAVGWMIGKAMLAGSNGAGGRRYQVTAVALTYFAVSMAAVPIGISYAMKHRAKLVTQQAQRRQTQQQLADEQRQLEQESGQKTAPAPAPEPDGPQTSNQAVAPEPTETRPAAPRKTPMEAMLGLLFLGLASPFMELASNPFGGMIGIVILFIGIRIAWTMTAGQAVQIFGPFETTASGSS